MKSTNDASNTPNISQMVHCSNEEIPNREIEREELIETKPEISKQRSNDTKQEQSGTLEEEPMPLNLTYHQCALCSKKYGSIEHVTKHLSIFHKIGSEFQKALIKIGSFY